MLKKYLKGSVPEEEKRAAGGKGASGSSSEGSGSLVWVAYAIPAIAVIVAVLYQYGIIGGPRAK